MAFEHAGGWRRRTGTPILQVLQRNRCPLCPEIQLDFVDDAATREMFDWAMSCACCRSVWLVGGGGRICWQSGPRVMTVIDEGSADTTVSLAVNLVFSSGDDESRATVIVHANPMFNSGPGPLPPEDQGRLLGPSQDNETNSRT